MLLEAGDVFTQISDLISEKWAEILAIFGGSITASVIVGYLVKIIATFLIAKIKNKYTSPINSSIEILKTKEAEIFEKLVAINEYLDNMPEIIQSEFAKYDEKRKKIYQQIIDGKEIFDEAVEEVAVDLQKLEETPTEEIVEEIQEEIVEQVDEPQEEVEQEPKSTKKVAKRIIRR